MQVQKINGSGVMIFIECKQEIYVLLLSSTGRGGVFFTEAGGKLEPRLNTEENAIKELFEETYATFKVKSLKQSKNVIVNNKYVCFTIKIQMDDLMDIEKIMKNNRKILNEQKGLNSYREMFGFQFVKVNDLLQLKQKSIQSNGQQISLHKRTINSFEELIKQKIIREDFTVDVPVSQCQVLQHQYENQNDKLHSLNKQCYLSIS
ncbi:unnamed protein product (macronuclear) [Paramecium tetraurelia]|uniref:Nudix hydrolase domain-containing protein n=1 Tax=Paramecium tetraurelia TaxID=5888 RepID=A0CTT2_PARTE|nr:uncharacterized protein GSPATT00010433001 [Paramecium tetraurelia]CAK74199.1 unnamed protein product [Paramecium tetraurelia]|eukprot:XP_001441596.1 hypothetical protein (macronuclear) [Paramecium tetraurelia strain d4-2]